MFISMNIFVKLVEAHLNGDNRRFLDFLFYIADDREHAGKPYEASKMRKLAMQGVEKEKEKHGQQGKGKRKQKTRRASGTKTA